MDSSRDSRGIDVPESPCVAERSEKEEPCMKSTTIAVDVAKEVLEVAVSARPCQGSPQKPPLPTAILNFSHAPAPGAAVPGGCRAADSSECRRQALGCRVVLLP